jgi:hypothetical protein
MRRFAPVRQKKLGADGCHVDLGIDEETGKRWLSFNVRD